MKRTIYSLILVMVFATVAVSATYFALVTQENLSSLEGELHSVKSEHTALSDSNGTVSIDNVDPDVVTAWRDHYSTVSVEFQNNLARALRESGGAITDSSPVKTVSRQFETTSSSCLLFEQTIVGNLSSVLNVLGTIERQDPLLRVERIRLSGGGESIDCFLQVAIPQINLEGVGE